MVQNYTTLLKKKVLQHLLKKTQWKQVPSQIHSTGQVSVGTIKAHCRTDGNVRTWVKISRVQNTFDVEIRQSLSEKYKSKKKSPLKFQHYTFFF